MIGDFFGSMIIGIDFDDFKFASISTELFDMFICFLTLWIPVGSKIYDTMYGFFLV
jgi:hypothetical protein